MVTLDDAIIARWEKGGEKLEILVDPEVAQQLKEGEEIENLAEHLATEEIFKDSRKGDRPRRAH